MFTLLYLKWSQKQGMLKVNFFTIHLKKNLAILNTYYAECNMYIRFNSTLHYVDAFL